MSSRGAMDRRERGGGSSFASKYRIILVVWAMGLILLSSTMLGGAGLRIAHFAMHHQSDHHATRGA